MVLRPRLAQPRPTESPDFRLRLVLPDLGESEYRLLSARLGMQFRVALGVFEAGGLLGVAGLGWGLLGGRPGRLEALEQVGEVG